MYYFKIFILLLVCSFNSNSMASNDQMVKSLMKLRYEVELLHSQIEQDNDNYRATMKSLTRQKNDLDAQINRKQTHWKEIRQNIQKIKQIINKRNSKHQDLRPLLIRNIQALRDHIQQGLPFRLEDRLKDLDLIQSQLESKAVTPQKALARLWSSYEDALRLSKENGIFKQVITLENKQILSEVVKIGMVMLFFQTPDDKVGFITKQQDTWIYQQTVDEKQQQQIRYLIDAIKKQIRSGYFTLPNAIQSKYLEDTQ
jgi:hypothetical protein